MLDFNFPKYAQEQKIIFTKSFWNLEQKRYPGMKSNWSIFDRFKIEIYNLLDIYVSLEFKSFVVMLFPGLIF